METKVLMFTDKGKLDSGIYLVNYTAPRSTKEYGHFSLYMSYKT